MCNLLYYSVIITKRCCGSRACKYDYLARVLCVYKALGCNLMSLIGYCRGWSFNGEFLCCTNELLWCSKKKAAIEFRNRKLSLILCSLERQRGCFDFLCVVPALSRDGTWKTMAWDLGWKAKSCFGKANFQKRKICGVYFFSLFPADDTVLLASRQEQTYT